MCDITLTLHILHVQSLNLIWIENAACLLCTRLYFVLGRFSWFSWDTFTFFHQKDLPIINVNLILFNVCSKSCLRENERGLWFLAEWCNSCNVSVWMYAVISLLLHGSALLLRYLTWNLFLACLTCYHRDLTTQEILIQVININCYSPPKPSLYVCLNWTLCRLPVLINSEQCSKRCVRKHAFVHRSGNLGFVSAPSLTGAGPSKFGSNPGELFPAGQLNLCFPGVAAVLRPTLSRGPWLLWPRRPQRFSPGFMNAANSGNWTWQSKWPVSKKWSTFRKHYESSLDV